MSSSSTTWLTIPLLTPNRLMAWTYVLAVVEYRPYLPPSGERIVPFIGSMDRGIAMSK
ncbi:hypothetical protein [Nocardia sp. NPDC058705]|uniref:hypothetical protein n=1 Tax=Nocardia sp. NPDC058705 TaxID=3346609 RepID=UPI0036D187F8